MHDLVEFHKDRNIIANNYYRVFRLETSGKVPRSDGQEFLLGFINRSQYLAAVLRGFLLELMQSAAIKEGREAEIAPLTEKQR